MDEIAFFQSQDLLAMAGFFFGEGVDGGVDIRGIEKMHVL
jgi:hypothetical protein